MTPNARIPLRTSATTQPTALAGAVAAEIRQHGDVELTAVGAAAVNQAIKAVAIARGYLAPRGQELVCIPSFFDLAIEGTDVSTGIRLLVKAQ